MPGCRILCVERRRPHAPALRGAVRAIHRHGLAPQGTVPAGRCCRRAALTEVSQGGECGRRGRSRRAAAGSSPLGPRAGGHHSGRRAGSTAHAASRLERDAQALSSLATTPPAGRGDGAGHVPGPTPLRIMPRATDDHRGLRIGPAGSGVARAPRPALRLRPLEDRLQPNTGHWIHRNAHSTIANAPNPAFHQASPRRVMARGFEVLPSQLAEA